MRYKLDPLSTTGLSPEVETKIVQSTSHAMPGRDGADGVGVPLGGTTGQVLSKNSNTDFDTEWTTPATDAVTSVNTRTGAVTGLAEASDVTAHTGNTSNPHGVTKAQVGLGNADNTSDLLKPISTATQTALNGKVSKTTPPSVSVYTETTSGVTIMQPYTSVATENTIMYRTTGGVTNVGTPTGGTHAANKAYVDARIVQGTGFPNGVVTANAGTIYIDTAVTNGASSWIKKSGTGSTGWQVLEGDTGARNITSTAVGAPVFSGGVWLRRKENIVTISIADFESTWATAGTWLEMIPGATMDGFKPTTPGGENYTTLFAGTFARMQVLTNGVVRVYSASSSGTFRIHNTCTYITGDAWPTTLPGVSV